MGRALQLVTKKYPGPWAQLSPSCGSQPIPANRQVTAVLGDDAWQSNAVLDHTLLASCSHWHKASSPFPGQHSSCLSQAWYFALKSSISPTPGAAFRCETAGGFACYPPSTGVLLLHLPREDIFWLVSSLHNVHSVAYRFALLVTQPLSSSPEPLHPTGLEDDTPLIREVWETWTSPISQAASMKLFQSFDE